MNSSLAYFRYFWVALMLYAFFPTHAQSQKSSCFDLIEQYLAEGHLELADSLTTAQVHYHQSQRHYDSLAAFPYYVGWVKYAQGNTNQAIQSSEGLVAFLEKHGVEAALLWEAYLELAMFYELIGNAAMAYEKNQNALVYALKSPSATGEDIGKIESNLGAYAQRLGNIALSKTHHLKALKNFTEYPKTSLSNLFNSHNNMGAIMWYSSKADSALYHYSSALKYLEKMPPTPKNKFYRRAMVLSNMSGLLDTQGKKTEALQMMQEVIKALDQYIQQDINHAEKRKAMEFKFQAIDNLGGGYKSLGDYTKALDLLKYSFLQKQKYFGPESPEVFKSLILLGQAALALKNYQTASTYLDKGLAMLKKIDGPYLFWHAEALSSKGIISEELGEPEAAAAYYAKSESMYETALQGTYDNIYLEFLARVSLYYAKTGKPDRAKATAYKGYDFIVKTQGDKTLLAFIQMLNLAAVHFELGEYETSLMYSKKGISVLNNASAKSDFFIDSVQIEFSKPAAILFKTKAEFQLQGTKDQLFLEGLLRQLDTAIYLLERHKSVFSSPENLNILIHDNKEVFDFAKKIALELYFITEDEKFLDRAIGLHESSLYNRIRSRLNIKGALRFAHVPDHILAREKAIRQGINKVLETGGDSGQTMPKFFTLTSQWNNFLSRLKQQYPQYYKMRYATIAVPVADIQSNIPTGTTVVRYFFVETQLYALVMDSHKKRLHKLSYDSKAGLVAKLNNPGTHILEVPQVIQQLYGQVWAPFDNEVTNEKIVIIPDGDLFNLSFEMLAAEKITSFADLAQVGLLAQHTLSYNYSLLLLKEEQPSLTFEKPFIAFAPGFSNTIKQAYKNSMADSIEMDLAYLRLLPQPFTFDLINHLKSKFGGKAFVQAKSTKRNFKAEASRHKVLHIGTHAASNNLNPELSRLIFAKDLSSSGRRQDNNALYAYEIYNYDLASNLTVLTACETGKPGYQAGEGMISLAHAFNYAGSQSMLTSLWQVDEQSSTIIMEFFYQYLSEGYAKDEALKQAKLDYLASAEGRTAAPQYWAGLIIMGDTSAIYLKEKGDWKYWAFGSPLVLLLLATIFYRRKFR